jgi:hypothetical protein
LFLFVVVDATAIAASSGLRAGKSPRTNKQIDWIHQRLLRNCRAGVASRRRAARVAGADSAQPALRLWSGKDEIHAVYLR